MTAHDGTTGAPLPGDYGAGGEAGTRSAEWPLPFVPADTPGGAPPPPPERPAAGGGGVSWYIPLVGYCLMAFGLLVAVGAAVGGVLDNFALDGSGNVVTETRPVSGFREIAVEGTGQVVITQGDRESLTIEAEDNVLRAIESEVRNGRLTLDRDGWWFASFRSRKPVIYHVTVKELTAVRLSGAVELRAGDLRANRLEVATEGAGEATLERLTADELVVSLHGAGTIRASGTVTRQEVEMGGAGEYLAGDLASRDARVELRGAGEATIRVSDNLDVRISGPGEVSYIGNPQVKHQISGPGDIHPLSGR